MRRMLFFDIDGTLVNSRDRTIPDSTGRAIRLARAAGHLVYVNSGRPWCGVDPRVKAMGFHGFVCGCGLYIREGDEILFRQRMAKDVQQWAVDLVRRYRLQVMYEGADHVYFDLTRPLAPQVAAEKAYYDRMGLDTEGDPAGPEADFDKFVVLGLTWMPSGGRWSRGSTSFFGRAASSSWSAGAAPKERPWKRSWRATAWTGRTAWPSGTAPTTCPCWRRRE